MKFRLGITGSEQYEFKNQIKNLIFNLKKQYNDELIIYSRGSSKGADKNIRKFCLEFNVNYYEFSPSYLSKTLYSFNQNEAYYNKEFSGRDIYKRSLQMIKVCKFLILFKYENDKSIDYMITQLNKLQKPYKLIEKYEAVGIR